MLLENITLSDYSDNELKQFIDEAKRVLDKREEEHIIEKMKQFKELWEELRYDVYFKCEDENGYISVIDTLNLHTETPHLELSFSSHYDY